MEQILTRLLDRPSLQQARLAGTAVRGELMRDPHEAWLSLASWSGHPNAYVRIASGVGYGLLGMRDREALADVLPFVERLATDPDPEVREHGAQTALEQLWLAHTDAICVHVEQWLRARNDQVGELVVRTVARVATGGQIQRPSVLRRFIEQGLALFDVALLDATPRLLAALAECVDEIGAMAPDLVIPFVREWAGREDRAALRLVHGLSKLPIGAACEGVDFAAVAARLSGHEGRLRLRAADWVRSGVGTVDYVQVVAPALVAERSDASVPWTHSADPYRGCQLRCEFCNARSMTEWVGETPDEFVRRVTVLQNAPQVLAEELADPRLSPRDRHVICLGRDSDPYQPAEERFEVTREMLKVFLAHSHPVVVQTRQGLVLRDLDILEHLAEQGLVNVLVSMQTPIEGIRNKLELGTSTMAERFRTMRMLAKKGVPVGLLLSPIMPELTDDPGILEETVRRAADAGARWVVAQVLDLRGSAGVKVRLLVDRYITALLPRYEEFYARGAGPTEPDPDYVRRMTREVVPELAARHGIVDLSRMLTSGRDPATLLARA